MNSDKVETLWGDVPTVGDLLGLTPEKVPCDFTHRRSVLEEATRLTAGDRNVAYGDPRKDFERTARIWSAYLMNKLSPGQKINHHDVAAMMIGLKLSRIAETPGKRDSWVDAAGYAACGFECVELDREEG